MHALDSEQRKQRRKVLFDIGVQLRRVYNLAEQEPVPDHITRLVSQLTPETTECAGAGMVPSRSQA